MTQDQLVVLHGGIVYDGIDITAKRVDVVVQNGLAWIAADAQNSIDSFTIDVSDRVVCPGFIDLHGSSAWRHLLPGGGLPKLHQGITTEVVGNCGHSEYPVSQNANKQLSDQAARFGIDLDWHDSSTFGSKLMQSGIQTNIILAVGLRRIMEFADPRTVLRREIACGASGLSSGLVYPPGIEMPTEVIAKIASEARPGHHSIHIRNERESLSDAVAEAINIAALSETRTLISHLKAAEKSNWGTVHGAVQQIQDARDKGIDITFETYPYTAVSTSARTFLPPHLAKLPNNDIAAILSVGQASADALDYFERRGMQFDKMRVVGRQSKISNQKPMTAYDFIEEIISNPDTFVVYDCMSRADVDYLAGVRWSMIGSDTWSIPFNGVPSIEGMHPRTFGAFAKFLSDYSLNTNSIPLGEAIRRITSAPADWLRTPGRGRIGRGLPADLIVFDPDKYGPTSTYAAPNSIATGVEWVFVNGKPAIANGVAVEAAAHGQIIHAIGGS